MEEEVRVSTLPWSWVIEALAKSQLVNATLLCKLFSKVPPLSGDSGINAREAAALRCFERLCDLNESSHNHVVSDLSEIAFDPAESAETVLMRVLSEISDSKGASDELKWRIQYFIKHKKSSLPKSTLELLKDALLEDNHPLASSLKEFSGLGNQDQCVLNVPFDDGEPISPSLRSGGDDEGDRALLAEENLCFPKSRFDNQLVQAYIPKGSSLPCRVDISTCCTNHVQEIDATSIEMDNQCPPAKKLKMDTEYGMQSKKQHSIPVGSNYMCDDAEDGQYCEVIEENGFLDGKDDEQATVHVENYGQPPISPNKGDHCHEGIDPAMNIPNFLSSQSAFTKDYLARTESQPNTCLKCNEDGQLLSCSASSCPLLFHESCLGCSTYFDDQGYFYCPFCAYSRAISEYARAKEKLFLVRKELAQFVGGSTDVQPAHNSNTSSKDNVNQDRDMKVDKTAEVENGANNVTQVAEPHQSNLKGKQLNLPHSSAYMGANGFVLSTKQHLSFKDRQGAEIIIQLSRGPAGFWNYEQHDHGCDEQIMNGSVEFAELKRKKETNRCKITELYGDSSSESISNSDGLVQDKSDSATNSLAYPKPLSQIPARQFRRKKVPWTAEEEAILMKGVDEFAHANGRTIPWKTILEYGGSVFQKGRTAIDLKDKWRNLNRKTTPSKVKL